MFENPYSILGIREDASELEIKRAYKTLISKYHPDVCNELNANEKAAMINEAYNKVYK